MEHPEIIRRLKLFGIPPENTADAGAVRELLARLLAAGSLSLAELQTARDIVQRTGSTDPWAYLFLATMFLSLREGNTFLRMEQGSEARGPELLRRAGYLDEAPASGEGSNGWFESSVNAAWQNHAEKAAESIRGDVVVRNTVKGNVEGWFFAKHYDAVCTVSEKLATMTGLGDAFDKLSDLELTNATKFNGFTLNNEQLDAVKKIAQRRFVVVTGGPGTGKTTIVCAFLRALLTRGDVEVSDIALAAPTGRAAQRMGEALRNQCARSLEMDKSLKLKIESLSGATLHSLLGGYPPNWKYTAENRMPYRLVVVDEASMVDVNLMKALLAALRDDCRLVLLGDKDQLPSVDAGAVLGDIVGGVHENAVATLKESNRFTGKLAAAATAINEGEQDLFQSAAKELSDTEEPWTDTLQRTDEDHVNRVFRYTIAPGARNADVENLFVEWAEAYGLLTDGKLVQLAASFPQDDPALQSGIRSEKSTELFAELDRSRILTVVRKGPCGVQGVNELLVKKRYGGRLPANPFERPGVPVLITRNTRERGLFNGDIGITVEGTDGIMFALFPRGDRVVVCPVGLLPEHDLAYAITVHKSQGSEFENVLVVLPDSVENPLLSRQLVYTGVTRAKKRAVVLGTDAAFAKALKNNIKRDTGIG